MAMSKLVLIAGAASLMLGAAALAQPVKPSTAVVAAVAHPSRPAADTARDANRKPAEVVAASGLKPGDVVAELGSGGGYYTRILSKVVGPQGKVLAIANAASLVQRPQSADAVKAIAAQDPTVTVVADTYTSLAALPQKVDMVWTTDNYHDFHNGMDIAAFNKAVFNALKPGGVFFVEDHAAVPGVGATATRTLHRIEPVTVKEQVTAAGFKLVRESDVLRTPAGAGASENSEGGSKAPSDRFIMVFQKPA